MAKLFLILSNLALLSALAQNPQTGTQLQEVVISATRLADSVGRTPSSITVLTPAELTRFGTADISNAVNSVPGLVMQSGAINTNRISIRGIGARTPFGTNRIRAFYGPIPLTSGDGETTIEDLDLESLGKIEFVRGPRASVYGAGLGGAILISPAIAPKNPEAQITSTHGSFGLLKNAASASFRETGVHYHNLSLDGWRQNSQYSREGTTLTSKFRAGKNGQVLILANHTRLKAFIPSSINAETFAENPAAAAPTWLAAQGYESYRNTMGGIGYQASGKIKPSISVFGSVKQAYEPRPFDILEQRGNSWGVRAQATSGVVVKNLNINLEAGAEYFRDAVNTRNFENLYAQNQDNGSLQGDEISSGRQSREFLNAFAQSALRWQRWRAQAGINLNSTRFESAGDSGGGYGFDPILSPEISVSYHLEKGIFYLSAGKGFSLPTVQETLDAAQNFNRGLNPETGLSIEAGAKLRMLKNRLQIEATVFDMDVRNLLVARRIADDQYVGINAGSTSHRGLELMARYLTTQTRPIKFSALISGNIGRFIFTDFVDRDTDFSGNKLTGVPASKWFTELDARHRNGLYANAGLLYMGSVAANDANSVFADSYHTLHARLGFHTTLLETFLLDISVGGTNIANAKFASMVQVNALAAPGQQPRFFYPGAPSSVYFRISATYKLN